LRDIHAFSLQEAKKCHFRPLLGGLAGRWMIWRHSQTIWL
jgi:hypothetical protein